MYEKMQCMERNNKVNNFSWTNQLKKWWIMAENFQVCVTISDSIILCHVQVATPMKFRHTFHLIFMIVFNIDIRICKLYIFSVICFKIHLRGIILLKFFYDVTFPF
jgi:hypothetical protein